MTRNTTPVRALLAAAGVVVAGVATTAAVTGASAAETAAEAAGQDVVRQTASNVQLSPTGGVQTTVIAETLPAGSWVLAANAMLVGWGPSDYTRCQLYAGPNQVGAATTMVGAPSAGSAGTGVYVATVALHGAYTRPNATAVSLRCSHDTTRAAGETPYVDPRATLWAHGTDSLGIQG